MFRTAGFLFVQGLITAATDCVAQCKRPICQSSDKIHVDILHTKVFTSQKDWSPKISFNHLLIAKL